MRSILILANCLFCLSVAAQQPSLASAPQPSNPAPDPRWSNVLKLHPGEPVEFTDNESGRPRECVLRRVDETALVCESEDDSAPTKDVVYPQAGIDSVWVFRSVKKSRRSRFIIDMAVGAFIGAGTGAGYGSNSSFIGLGLGGAALGAAIAAKGPRNQFITKRFLIYSYR